MVANWPETANGREFGSLPAALRIRLATISFTENLTRWQFFACKFGGMALATGQTIVIQGAGNMRTSNSFGRVVLAAMLAMSVPAAATAQAVRAPAAVPAKAGAGATGFTAIAYVAAALAGLGLIYVVAKKNKNSQINISRG